ncbi:MAG TPA: hypothetical protein VLE23_01510 [Geminicoccaceae bacterium]|nr:hypothetical protein [Geminicoccaceae bacterium]
MPARHRRARAIGIVVMGLLAGPAGDAAFAQPEPLETAEAPVSCLESLGHRQCLRRCTPANLMFLPWMAVGARAMPACREREIELCVDACRRRFC